MNPDDFKTQEDFYNYIMNKMGISTDEQWEPVKIEIEESAHLINYDNAEFRFEWALQEGLPAGTEVRYSVPF